VTIKLHENLPERLVAELQALGHDVDTVVLERLAGRDDADVWQAAQDASRFFITQDLDFSDVRRYSPGTRACCWFGSPSRVATRSWLASRCSSRPSP
jgi:predicted nuclease of predicted toxin-antitoxin system